MLDCSVVIGTFGKEYWREWAEHAAISAETAGAKEVLLCHANTLQEARNEGLFKAQSEWVVHLDADDRLTPNYLEKLSQGSADVRVPSICFSLSGQDFDLKKAVVPRVGGHYHACRPACLERGNYIIVGAMAKTELLQQIGGWKDYPVLEDYDLWQRCYVAGASFETIPEAIYLAQYRPGSRNRTLNQKQMAKHQYQISTTNMPNKDFSWLLR